MEVSLYLGVIKYVLNLQVLEIKTEVEAILIIANLSNKKFLATAGIRSTLLLIVAFPTESLT